MPVQVVATSFTAVSTGTTTVPYDDTIPQITEGTEFMTQAITPKSATNKLVIEANFFGAASVADQFIVALFQGATANALAAVSRYSATANASVSIPIIHQMTAGTTSSTTFRIRAGTSTAGTITFNGAAAGRLFGAITKSTMKITEYRG